jgi:hypothetical protein
MSTGPAVALRAWPNPARDELEVRFVLITGARARLEMVDVATQIAPGR